MSIFESKPQRVWRKIREWFGGVFGKIQKWLAKMGAEFRALPQAARVMIAVGGSMLAVLLVFAIVFWPMLQRPVPAPEGPSRETVAEATERLELEAGRELSAAEAESLLVEIDEQVHWLDEGAATDAGEKSRLLFRLYMLKGQVAFNSGAYLDAAVAYEAVLERGLAAEPQWFTLYSSLYYSYDKVNDTASAKRYAALAVEEYKSGRVDDDGGCVAYARAAGIDIKECPSIFDINDL
ncbi:MAG: hypothetical protein LBM12_02445 [Candidatus Nomurabacteria bacterium]|jgi:hypothetical protein|nr:hypothetical protein [Candidatus Nomurabacteria bacterium]